MRAREADEGSNANHPKEPPLMGGDGARGPGVVVDTMKDLPEPPTTVTLELMRSLDETDSTPPLCRVVGDGKVLCDASELIRNMTSVMEDTDSVTIPVPVEYIPSELVLRRVIEFAELQPTIPARFFTERDWCRCAYEPNGDIVNECPRSDDIWVNVRELFRKYVKEDGHRGGILDLFLASRYLMASKLRIASLQYVAMMINSWCAPSADTTKPLFGSARGVDRFGTDDDPLAKIPLSILSEISDVLLNSPVEEGKAIYAFSPTLFKSLAVNWRFWEPSWHVADRSACTTYYARNAKLEDPSCHLCSLLETRLEAFPTEPSGLLPYILAPTVHEHWFPLRRRVVEQCLNDETGHWRCGPPQWLVSNMDLANPDCAFMALMLERMKLRPGKTVAVPRLPAGGKEAIAECWREFYEHVLTESESIAYEFVASNADAKVYCVKEVASILQHTTSLRGLHIYQKPTAPHTFPEFPPSLSAQLDAAMITSLTIDTLFPGFIRQVMPPSVDKLWVQSFSKENDEDDSVEDFWRFLSEDEVHLKDVVFDIREGELRRIFRKANNFVGAISRSELRVRVWFAAAGCDHDPFPDRHRFNLAAFGQAVEFCKIHKDLTAKLCVLIPFASATADDGGVAPAAAVETPNFYNH